MEHEPNVDFGIVADIFVTSFRRKSFQTDAISKKEAARKVPDTITGTIPRQTDTIPDRAPSHLSAVSHEYQARGSFSGSPAKILELVAANQSISLAELAKETNLSTGGVRYHLARLRKDGVLDRVGRRGGRWIIRSLH